MALKLTYTIGQVVTLHTESKYIGVSEWDMVINQHAEWGEHYSAITTTLPLVSSIGIKRSKYLSLYIAHQLMSEPCSPFADGDATQFAATSIHYRMTTAGGLNLVLWGSFTVNLNNITFYRPQTPIHLECSCASTGENAP
jgi:hypothetical protein